MTFRPKKSIIFLRYVLATFGVLFLIQTCDLGSPTIAVAFSILFGIYFSNKCLKKNISLKSIVALHFLAYLIFIGGLCILASPIIGSSTPYYDLHPDIIKTEVLFLFALYCLTFTENHLFWKKTYLLSFEVVGLGFILISVLSGHRNYKIDIPNTISSLTWKLPVLQRIGAEPQQLLVGIGLIFGIVSISYIILANNSPCKLRSGNSIKSILDSSLEVPVKLAILPTNMAKTVATNRLPIVPKIAAILFLLRPLTKIKVIIVMIIEITRAN